MKTECELYEIINKHIGYRFIAKQKIDKENEEIVNLMVNALFKEFMYDLYHSLLNKVGEDRKSGYITTEKEGTVAVADMTDDIYNSALRHIRQKLSEFCGVGLKDEK